MCCEHDYPIQHAIPIKKKKMQRYPESDISADFWKVYSKSTFRSACSTFELLQCKTLNFNCDVKVFKTEYR